LSISYTKKTSKNPGVFLILSLLALSSFIFPAYFAGVTPLRFSSAVSSTWHTGTNMSTSEVDVNYTEMYGAYPNPNGNGTQDRLDGDMILNYQDGTGEAVLLGASYLFAPGGMDLADHQVLNWSKVISAGVTLLTQANVNGTSIGTMYSFMGFSITNGSANQFSLTQNFPTQNDTQQYSYTVNNIVGSINYANASSITIGNVALSTTNTTENGQIMTESIAKFNVTIDALLTDLPLPPLSPQQETGNVSSVPIPVVLMFEVTHDAVQTQIKYGVDIDWSAVKAFPNAIENLKNPDLPFLGAPALQNGDNFSLVAADRLLFGYGLPNGTSQYQTTFSTDQENDSAIYLVGGVQLCKEQFPTSYTISGSALIYNTTRDFVPVQFQSSQFAQSAMFVVFGGFKYNESAGFAFDPTVITPNSVSPSAHSTTTGSGNPSTSAHTSAHSSQSTGSVLPAFVIPAAIVAVVVVAAAMIVIRRRSVST
jgi:hypothetical protein